ncbi:MAG: methionine biosynthesis protein MetW [Planctomycetota bacterium]
MRGKAPVTIDLPFAWHNLPNMRFLSPKDFGEFCRKRGVQVDKGMPLIKTRRAR